MDVPIAGVTEAGHGQAVFLFEPFGESEKLFEPPARHDDVFVELREARVTQGLGELAAELPDFLALPRALGRLNKSRTQRAQDFLHCP